MNEQKNLAPAELPDELLEKAAGGLATYLDPGEQRLVRVKKCGNYTLHRYDVGLTACPVCHSINFTYEYIDKDADYYK